MRTGGLYGPDVSFLSIEKCDLEIAETFVNKDAVIVLGADGLQDLAIVDAGDAVMPPTDIEISLVVAMVQRQTLLRTVQRLRSAQCSLAVRLINILWVVLN